MDENRIDLLKARSRHCVCKYCGSRLHLKRIIFGTIDEAQVELFCEFCDRIEFGVEQAVYQCAKDYVGSSGFNYYQDLEETEQLWRMNIAKVCEILAWADEKRGICDERGFLVPITIAKRQENEMIFFCADELKESD